MSLFGNIGLRTNDLEAGTKKAHADLQQLTTTASAGFADMGRQLGAMVADNIDTRTAAGRLVLNVLGSVAQWERETIGERTDLAQNCARSEGPPPQAQQRGEDRWRCPLRLPAGG